MHAATFSVQEVPVNTVAKKVLSESDHIEAWGNFCSTDGGKLFHCSAPPDNVVEYASASAKTNCFAGAISTAFFEHYPLELSPDAIWLTIVQGFAQHVTANAEKLRHLFVKHDGQAQLEVVDLGMTLASPGQVWADNILKFESLIGDHIGKERSAMFTPTFSTSTNASKVAFTVCLMDMMQQYFVYGLRGGCGIPSVTLLGTLDDWKSIRNGAQALKGYDCDWWLDELLPVLDQFVAAASGTVNREFWGSLCSIAGGSGDDVPFTGWMNSFFPYVKGASKPLDLRTLDSARPGRDVKLTINSVKVTLKDTDKAWLLTQCIEFLPCIYNGQKRLSGEDLGRTLAECGIVDGSVLRAQIGSADSFVRSSYLSVWRTGGKGMRPESMPSGLSSAPMVYREGADLEVDMTLRAGFIAITQNPTTMAVSPAIGWSIAVKPRVPAR